jgi:hypothetical protein
LLLIIMTTRKHRHKLLDQLAAAEERFLCGTFLAPVRRGGEVRVRIAGVICRLTVAPPDFEGWGVFQPTSAIAAQLVRPARLAERQRYLELFPRMHLILGGRAGADWLAVPAHQSDRRFQVQGAVPLQLVEEGQLFETVESRFDGAHWWFDRADGRRDPGAAAYLRQALRDMVAPDRLNRAGLTAEERAAYTRNYEPRFRAQEAAQRDRTEQRLRQALAHAGAGFRGYMERADCYRVEYDVDGGHHVSVVGKEDLRVQAAGICLSGTDQHFDLQSLVGVIREGQEIGHIVRVGTGLE